MFSSTNYQRGILMLGYRFTKKHLSDSEIRRYQRRETRPDELISANDHLAACAECFQRFHDPKLVEAAYRFVRESLETKSDRHLLYEQLAGYADDSLGAPEREAVERHLASCEECEADLQSFFDLSSLISTKDQRALFSKVPSVNASPTLRERLRVSLQVPSFRSLLSARSLVQATSLLVIVAFVIWGVTRSTQKQIDGLKLEITQLQAENDSMREKASNANAQIAQLKQNEEIRQAGDQSQTALRLDDGIGQVALDETGTVQGLDALPAELRTAVQGALTSARLQIAPGPAVKIGRVGTLLGDGGDAETFKLITPVSSIVLSNIPAFKWEALPGATGYTVLLRDVNTGKEIESESLSDTQWTPKEPLARGHTYAWMVEAARDGRRLRSPALNQPYAGFKVLEKHVFDNIQRAQASWGNSHLVMGILYAKAGLKDAARKELKELQAANPDVHIINKLIKSLDSKK
jgi:FtsZ-binding cell division protein ZapB